MLDLIDSVKNGHRARVTLDRSNTGQEEMGLLKRRPIDLSANELISEASRRNSKHVKEDVGYSDESVQTIPLFGQILVAPCSFSFFGKLKSIDVKRELLRFIAERHDSHLTFISALWDSQKILQYLMAIPSMIFPNH